MTYFLLILFGAIAWFISTIAAGGAATLLIPIIGFILGAEFVAPLLSIASLCANPSRVWLFRKNICMGVIVWLVPGSLIGAFFGAYAFTQVGTQWIQVIIGCFLLSYVLQDRFSTIQLRLKTPTWLFLPLGILISFLSGLIGATGPVLNPFMLNHGLTKEHMVATKSLNSLLMQLTKLLTYGGLGVLTVQLGLWGITLGLGAVVGVYFARHHLLRIDIQRFRHYTMTIMAISGILMLFKGIPAL